MLEDTLVIWSGEFGLTAYSQGKLTKDNYGRDYHPRCFTAWMAGGGIKPGMTYGATDDYATILNQLGINRTQLTTTAQGRRFRLTDVHGHVVKELLA